MGCLFSRFHGSSPLDEEDDAPKAQFSWDKREEINVKDFIVENLKNETVGRVPGSINGQQFVIQNCEDCNIYLYDQIATVTVDDCVNCRIFIGPTKSSVFVRDCKECKFVMACQQFRTRDCQKLDIYLCCATQPIIEASTGMKFGCFQYYYPELEGQFKTAEISTFNNNWSNIHDFTEVPGETNYSLLPENAVVNDYVPTPSTEQFRNMQIDTNRSVVPLSSGSRRKVSDEGCLIVFFNDGGSYDRAMSMIGSLKRDHPHLVLVQTKEIPMQPQDAVRVFNTNAYTLPVQQGPVIGLEYNGDGCVQVCQDFVVDLLKGTTGLVFVSQSQHHSAQQIESFFNFADMQMGV